MGLLILVTGIFAGLFLAIATLYSIAQAMMAEGRLRWVHVASLAATFAVMAALQVREAEIGRLLALPQLGAALATVWLEERWYRIFPLMVAAFAVIVLAGFVAL